MRRLAAVVVAVTLAGVAPAAGQTPPPVIEGLEVTKEPVAEGDTSRREYLEAIDLYSLRPPEGELVATLQIGRFADSAPVDDPDFLASIAAQVGTTVPQEQRLGDVDVYVTRGTKLALTIWFRDKTMFILSIREGYERPKTLIRHLLDVRP